MKTLTVSEEVWKKLWAFKLKNNIKSFDKVIKILIKEVDLNAQKH